MTIDPLLAAALFAVALLAGLIDTIAGGGGLLTVPALLWAGLSPAQALATNKLQASFGSGSATAHFIAAGEVAPARFPLAIATCAGGAALGAWSINQLDPSLLRTIVPVMLLGAALFFLFSPRLPSHSRPPAMGSLAFALLLPTAIGFYDGFFGPGTGSFLVLSLVTLQGMELTAATARTKVLNFASNLASLAFFVFSDQILWQAGLIMAAGQALGARLGAKLVLQNGHRLIRPVLVAMSLALTVKVLAGH